MKRIWTPDQQLREIRARELVRDRLGRLVRPEFFLGTHGGGGGGGGGGLWDDFEDNSKDTGKWAGTTVAPPWILGYTLGGTVSETGGTVVMNMTGDDLINGYSSNSTTHDLNEKEIIVHLSGFDTNTVAGTGFTFGCFVDGSEATYFELFNNFGTVNLQAKYNNSGSQGTMWEATYSSTNHAWLRIREISGDWYWDTAPNSAGVPGTWVNRRQRSVDGGTPANHWNPSSVSFGFWTFGPNNARCVAAAFDTDI